MRQHSAVIGLLMLAMNGFPNSASAQSDAVPLSELVRAPAVTLRNGQLSVGVWLPDEEHGFYRGTRFDRAGVIGSLTYRGHDFYVPWFDARSAGVRDYVFENGAVIASPNTAATGPVEEFNGEGGALGYAEAAPGGTFLKIGVGVLRRIDEENYNRFYLYPLVDPGLRTRTVADERADFTHEVNDTGSGYGYAYTKTLQLLPDQPVMLIGHKLKNTGSKPIVTTVYNHNFLNIDGLGTTSGIEMSTVFDMQIENPPDPALAELAGNQFLYRASPPEGQRVAAQITGFAGDAGDYDFRIVNRDVGAGVRITGDRPMTRVSLWSIGPVMSIEPFIAMSIPPGESFTWSYRYAFEAD